MRYGYFEYQVMFFGLSNAPASFQGYINKIFAEKHDVLVIVYSTLMTSWFIPKTLAKVTWKLSGRSSENSGNTACLPTWKSVVFIKKKFASQATSYLAKESAWRKKELTPSRLGLNWSQYETFRCSSSLPISIGVSSKTSAKSLPYSPQC